MKPSLPMRHAKAPEGKKAHLWFAPNTLEPSRRPVSVKMYLSAMTYWARPRYDRIADSMTPLPAGESCEPEPRLKTCDVRREVRSVALHGLAVGGLHRETGERVQA